MFPNYCISGEIKKARLNMADHREPIEL